MDSAGVHWYYELSVAVGAEDVEPVSNYIIDNIAGGLLLEDEEDSGHTVIRFYLADGAAIDDKIEGLERYLSSIKSGTVDSTIKQRKIKNLDWIEAYKKSVIPVFVGDSIVIVPPWEETVYPDKIKIILEPKMAFGTGRHETSRSCLAELERLDISGKTMLDLGSGSGILGIYAALRGATEIIGYDIDPLAVENSRENYILNNVSEICRSEAGTIDNIKPDAKFDIVMVNIIKAVIVPIIGRLIPLFKSPGVMILSGLMDKEKEEIETVLKEHNLNDYSIRHDNEWVTFTINIV